MKKNHDRRNSERTNSDDGFKYFIHKKYVLSRILKDNLDELRNMTLEEIYGCLNLGEDGDTVIGRETEYYSPGHKKIVMDSVFDIKIPGTDREVSVIVGVEGQNDPHPGYPLGKRAEYYLARMVSAQKGKEFDGKNYSDLRKTYSIWCILEPRDSEKNTVIRYRMKPERTFGTGTNEPENLDTFNVIMVNIGSYQDGLPESLAIGSAMFSAMEKTKRRQLMKDRFNIELDNNELERLNDMSDTYQDKYDHGYREGRIDERYATNERYINGIVSLAKMTELSVDTLILTLNVPEEDVSYIKSEVKKRLDDAL